jgi:hypothetical protein
VLRGGRCHASDSNDNYDGVGEEDTQGCEKGTGQANRTKDGKGQVKEKATEKGKG